MKKLLFTFLIFISGTVYATSNNANYDNYMLKLVQIAKASNPTYPFAAMIIDNKTGKILCTGVNKANANHNPILHGEIDAINECVIKYGKKINWSTSTLLTIAEPCPMCMSAIIWAGISKVVYGTSIKYLSEHKWKQIEISSEEIARMASFQKVTIIGGIMESQTNLLFIQSK
jgi:tRNA(adenine34) deaminase